MNNIEGFEISNNESSNRIIDIKIKDETINKLVFPFKKSNINHLVDLLLQKV